MFGCSDVYTFTKNRMETTSESGGAGAPRRSKPAVARISRSMSYHQEPHGNNSQRCCSTIRCDPHISEPISRGTATGQRNSRTRSRASCPRSRTSEHSSAGARGCDVRMFGCLYVHQEPHGNNIGARRSLSPIQTCRGKNIAAEAQSPKTKSRRCCETMIFVLSLSEPISRGTATGQCRV